MDRPTRFGAAWIIQVLAAQVLTVRGVMVQVVHDKDGPGGMNGLLAGCVSLIATFAGRMYSSGSNGARTRLLDVAAAVEQPAGAEGAVGVDG